MEKKLAGQLGNRIARELAGYLASEAHTNTQGWSSIDPDLRNAIVDTWGGMIADALAAGMTVVLDKEGAPQAGVTVEGTRSPQDRTADFQESYADVHQVYALLVSGRFEGLRSARFKSRGGAELELTLDPPKDKVEPGRMCSKCSVWMRRDVAEGQVQWTCPTCSVVEVDR